MEQPINFSREKLKEDQDRSEKRLKKMSGDLLFVGILYAAVIIAFGSGILLTQGESGQASKLPVVAAIALYLVNLYIKNYTKGTLSFEGVGYLAVLVGVSLAQIVKMILAEQIDYLLILPIIVILSAIYAIYYLTREEEIVLVSFYLHVSVLVFSTALMVHLFHTWC